MHIDRIRLVFIFLLFLPACRQPPPGGGFVKPVPWASAGWQEGIPSLKGILPVPAVRYPDKNGMGFHGGSIEGGIFTDEGIYALGVNGRVYIPSASAFEGDGSGAYRKCVYADMEIWTPDGRCYSNVQGLRRQYARYGRAIDREEDWYLGSRGEFSLSDQVNLGELKLPKGRQELLVCIKLYTFIPDTNPVGMVDKDFVKKIDPVPFFVYNQNITVDVPDICYADLRILRLWLNPREAAHSHDSHVPFLGSGKADLVYWVWLNRYTLYRSAEYTNADMINEPSPVIHLAFPPQQAGKLDTLWIYVGDDDDGFLGIGDKVDYIGINGYTWPDMDHPPLMVRSDSSFSITWELKKP